MSVNRRNFLAWAGAMAAVPRAWWTSADGTTVGRGRPFTWQDAENRVDIVHAVFSDEGDAVAVQVTRPLSAGGAFFGRAAGSLFDPRGDLWILKANLEQPGRLSALPGGAWAPCFSPNGKRLAALTLVGPGKVGIAVWDLLRGTHRIHSDNNVEISLSRFRSCRSAYGAPLLFAEVPRQYLWLDDTSLLFVDHGATPQTLLLGTSGVPARQQALRYRTEEGRLSVRVWNDDSPTCGAGGRLMRMCVETGRSDALYYGDVRGVSMSPGETHLAVLVATRNIPPVPNQPMHWPLLATTGFDDAMVQLGLGVIDLRRSRAIRMIDGVKTVGNAAPSRLPVWSADGVSMAVPVRATYSDAPSTGDDAVWEVSEATGGVRKWSASSALQAELLTMLLTADAVEPRAIRERLQGLQTEGNPALAGQLRGGAWHFGRGRVLFWNAPDLVLVERDRTLKLAGKFSAVQPPVGDESAVRAIAQTGPSHAAVITATAGGCRMEELPYSPDWTLLAFSSGAASAVYKDDRNCGSLLTLSRPDTRPLTSPLRFNTYFRDVTVPQARAVTRRFSDGTVRTGVLQLPVNHRPGDKHPVIVWAYPNWPPDLKGAFSRPNDALSVIYPAQYLLTQGFCFFQAPFPISGKDSADPMRAAVEAVAPWLDELRQQPDVIADEFGFFGHSNAGYVALALEAIYHRFKAIVAWDTFPSLGYAVLHSRPGDATLSCGANLVQAFRMFYEDPKQPYAPHPAPPWLNPAEYMKNQPLFNMSRASTPMLLVQGEFDGDSPEMEEVYSTLYGSGVPVELAYYWGEGHVFSSPGNIFDTWLRTTRFFRKYLRMR